MTLPKKSWIVVADGSKASIFLREGRNGELQAVKRMESGEARAHAGDIVSDRAGRVGESATVGRHAYEPKTDPHRHAEEVFVKTVADYVGSHEGAAPYDQLILVAPAKTLGQLRKDLPKAALGSVRHEVDKDLVHMPDDRIAQHIRDLDLA
jgi:protein required for attachment to host cells